MYSGKSRKDRVIAGSINMEYDIYPTLPGLELATCSQEHSDLIMSQ